VFSELKLNNVDVALKWNGTKAELNPTSRG